MPTNLSGNDISRVWRSEDGLFIYKHQPKFLCDNEWWCLVQLSWTGYVPQAERVNHETIKMDYIPNDPVLNNEAFMDHHDRILDILAEAGIRHGDLTKYAIRVMDDKPYLIDFAESRLVCDPRPDKRPEGDAYWLKRTMEELCNGV